VVMAPVLAIFGGRYEVGTRLVLSIGWLGLGMGMVTMLVLISLLARLEASRVSVLLLIVPAVTALASAPVLGEPLHPVTLLGMAVAMAGVGIAIRSGETPSPSRGRSAAARRRATSRPCTPAYADAPPARP
jgi:drug/metabolite transporter (DMT)-like permease